MSRVQQVIVMRSDLEIFSEINKITNDLYTFSEPYVPCVGRTITDSFAVFKLKHSDVLVHQSESIYSPLYKSVTHSLPSGTRRNTLYEINADYIHRKPSLFL